MDGNLIIGYNLSNNFMGAERPFSKHSQYVEVDLHELALAPSRLFRHSLFDFYIDEQRIVRKDGVEANLRPYERKILELLCANPNRALNREQLLRFASAADESAHLGSLNTINTHVHKLRKKIESQDMEGTIIETVPDVGFRLIDPDRPLVTEEVELSNKQEFITAVYKHPDFILSPGHMQIENDTGNAKLTTKEVKLMTYLMKNRDRLISQAELMHRFWPDGKASSLRVHISRLRKKLKDIGVDAASVIKSANGLGYVFSAEHKKQTDFTEK